ncbi:MAG: type III-A CRISPR-associated protein Csm2 [Candidatus Heimdallarchaeum endolithica]|uniref:CRISPR system Cms protein Csm2 n=1 Tax=Candidatus Heimdallarchaeum endolithica TaxID=2876572 RepID=A0A9Y1FPR9_9ARCH|nr:MAG: type III-A CRISPR-associated protein Csm2 [Candidatus Heimdallarchaeum endolithica]
MNSKKGYQSQRRSYGGGRAPQKDSEDLIKFFKDKMASIKNWSEYPVIDFAPKDGDAYKIAKAFEKESGGSKNKTTQLRKFYDQAIKAKLKLRGSNETEALNSAISIIMMIEPRAYMSFSRKNISKAVIDFISIALDKNKFRTNSKKQFEEDYNRFLKFFESVISYNNFLIGD